MENKTGKSDSTFFRQLFLSDIAEEPLGHEVLANQRERFLEVWKNKSKTPSNAIGIERIMKLALIALQFPFPGIYVRAISGRRGVLAKHLAIEAYVLFKITVAILILSSQAFWFFPSVWCQRIVTVFVIYMITESLLYTATLIFCSDVFATPRSYKRNIILLLSDYAEVVIGFASLYLIAGGLKYSGENGPFVSTSIDAAYFSFVTAVTIGYGDIVVTTEFGKMLVILQTIMFLVYGVLFLNFYISRIESK